MTTPSRSSTSPRASSTVRTCRTSTPVDQAKIDEYITHSWYDYAVGDDKGLNPYQGGDPSAVHGPEAPLQPLNTDEKYSWLKSPRYDEPPMQVGPLARMLVAYAVGVPRAPRS